VSHIRGKNQCDSRKLSKEKVLAKKSKATDSAEGGGTSTDSAQNQQPGSNTSAGGDNTSQASAQASTAAAPEIHVIVERNKAEGAPVITQLSVFRASLKGYEAVMLPADTTRFALDPDAAIEAVKSKGFVVAEDSPAKLKISE